MPIKSLCADDAEAETAAAAAAVSPCPGANERWRRLSASPFFAAGAGGGTGSSPPRRSPVLEWVDPGIEDGVDEGAAGAVSPKISM